MSHDTVQAAIPAFAVLGFWQANDTRDAMRALLPDYRLSKFQVALPEAQSLEVIGRIFLILRGRRGSPKAAMDDVRGSGRAVITPLRRATDPLFHSRFEKGESTHVLPMRKL